MPVIDISDPQSGSRAAISVESGFNCFRFVSRKGSEELDVIYAEDGFEEGKCAPSHNGIPILFPFPNRIRSGKYSWDGQDYDLPESLVSYDGSGNAIHGFCLDRAWRVTNQTESSVTAVFQISQDASDRASFWPADAKLSVQYVISGTTLRSEFTVHNPDDRPLPWGLGTHAYFRLPLGGTDAAQCTVFAPVIQSRQLCECLPTGAVVEIPTDTALQESPRFSSLRLDDAFAGLRPSPDGSIETWVTDPDSGRRVVQRFSADFQELVAFTPPWTAAICLEPYTCATDAINLRNQGFDAGLRVLESGDTWTGFIEIEAQL